MTAHVREHDHLEASGMNCPACVACLLQVAELPSRVEAALLSLMTSAVYDLESLRKVGGIICTACLYGC